MQHIIYIFVLAINFLTIFDRYINPAFAFEVNLGNNNNNNNNNNYNKPYNNHMSRIQAKQNHPSTFEDSPAFKGPIVLKQRASTSNYRCRIKKYYLDYGDRRDINNVEEEEETTTRILDEDKEEEEKNYLPSLILPKEELKPLKGTECTDQILKTIVDHFAYHDAPIDIKEVAESIEFYLRTRKRLFGAAKKYHAKCKRMQKKSIANHGGKAAPISSAAVETVQKKTIVYDLCSGHGLTGMLFAACNPPTKDRIVKIILVDQTEPPSFTALSALLGKVCPWLNDCIEFKTNSLEDFSNEMKNNSEVDDDSVDDVAKLVIAIHACGSLTDKVLEQAVELQACGIAAMPCCYTGTNKSVPYGIKRALGLSWSADIRRSFFLNDNEYHSDFSAIPVEITPMNRIIVGEEKG